MALFIFSGLLAVVVGSASGIAAVWFFWHKFELTIECKHNDDPDDPDEDEIEEDLTAPSAPEEAPELRLVN